MPGSTCHEPQCYGQSNLTVGQQGTQGEGAALDTCVMTLRLPGSTCHEPQGCLGRSHLTGGQQGSQGEGAALGTHGKTHGWAGGSCARGGPKGPSCMRLGEQLEAPARAARRAKAKRAPWLELRGSCHAMSKVLQGAAPCT